LKIVHSVATFWRFGHAPLVRQVTEANKIQKCPKACKQITQMNAHKKVTENGSTTSQFLCPNFVNYVCSVLYILFSMCQLALFGYPD